MLIRTVLVTIVLSLLFPHFGTGQEPSKDKESSSPAPRFDIQILRGYKLQILPGLDTIGAKIFKPGGLSIEFTSGEHLQKAADDLPTSKVYWKTRQTINGRQLTCAYTRSGYLVATFHDAFVVDFEARIRNKHELTEMLLMIATYEPSKGYPVDPGAMVPAFKPQTHQTH